MIEPPEQFDVFLSHAHVDAGIVERLGQRLEDEAICKVWLDKWILIPGGQWQQEMARAIYQAKTCAVCIGQDTPGGWFREEIGRALNRQVQDNNFRVIPVILPGGDSGLVDDFLELRSRVEFTGGIEDTHALHLLVSGIRGVAPGRGPYESAANPGTLSAVRQQLLQLRSLRQEQLIDDDIALEGQRRLLDRLLQV
jgi:hypothetical protein